MNLSLQEQRTNIRTLGKTTEASTQNLQLRKAELNKNKLEILPRPSECINISPADLRIFRKIIDHIMKLGEEIGDTFRRRIRLTSDPFAFDISNGTFQ